ncbi:hypothetical protein KDA00_04220 [Candidatus Saccharibacteria bacterium]|nr:hypothetical protein [Candidatus Saccharibacteria bacterium]
MNPNDNQQYNPQVSQPGQTVSPIQQPQQTDGIINSQVPPSMSSDVFSANSSVTQQIQNPSMGSQQPSQQQPGNSEIGGPKSSGKPKFLIVLVAGIVILGLMTAVALIVAKPTKKKTTSTSQQATDKNEGPQPAEAIDVEQTNNSINQDVSGLNTDEDYPTTQLDDKALGL